MKYINYAKLCTKYKLNITKPSFSDLLINLTKPIIIVLLFNTIIASIIYSINHNMITTTVIYSFSLSATYTVVLLYQYICYTKYKKNLNIYQETSNVLVDQYNINPVNLNKNYQNLKQIMSIKYEDDSCKHKKTFIKLYKTYFNDYINIILNKFYNNIDVPTAHLNEKLINMIENDPDIKYSSVSRYLVK